MTSGNMGAGLAVAWTPPCRHHVGGQ
jgi:hypothetical protein